MKLLRTFLILTVFAPCLLALRDADDAHAPRRDPIHGIGQPAEIPILTFSEANPCKTDVSSSFGLLLGPDEAIPKEPQQRPIVGRTLAWENGNPYLSVRFERLRPPHLFSGLWVSVFGHVADREVVLPPEIAEQVTAAEFRVKAPLGPIHFKVEAKGASSLITQAYFDASNEWQTLTMPLSAHGLKELVFVIESRLQEHRNGGDARGVFDVDDVCLVCVEDTSLRPPKGAEELLNWARDRCLHYFIWNYREPVPGRGIVLERNSVRDLVSIAGIGYAFPAFIVAEREGLLTEDQARSRVLGMLRWLERLDCGNGPGGLHGFPYHFLRPDGTRAGTSEVSTVDWAICAAGIRVARQRYQDEKEIARLATRLLQRPNWPAAMSNNGRISHGFKANGALIPVDWGSSFTEEAYLVAVEAVASGDVRPEVFGNIILEERGGFWPSWFGSGFTYNWLQLWTGPREPFATNSRKAYEREASFCLSRYEMPIMGLTACETFSGIDREGFLKWDKYAGEMGADVTLAGSAAVKHWSVCPYGAALALPFMRGTASAALFEYVKLGFVHPLLGFPDSIRLENLPEQATRPIPNWTQFAIDVGPMWMAIETCGLNDGRVAQLYLKDDGVRTALEQLDDLGAHQY